MPAVQIVSDLHLEIDRGFGTQLYEFELTPTAPVLALLGDIGCTAHEGLGRWLEAQLRKYEAILFVLGNHEPYNASLGRSITVFQQFAELHAAPDPVKGTGRFVFLNRTRFDLSPSTVILGCTLWSRLDPAELEVISWALNDFNRIAGFKPADYDALFRRDLEWLNAAVQEIAGTEPHKKIVIFTHHPPFKGASDPRYAANPDGDSLTSCFSTDLTGEPCFTSSQLVFWGFGHTHYNSETVLNGTRLLSNQRGYSSAGEPGFDAGKVVQFE